MLPCNHDNSDYKDKPFEQGMCRLCWLYHNDPAYKAAWDSQPVPKSVSNPNPKPCKCNRGNPNALPKVNKQAL